MAKKREDFTVEVAQNIGSIMRGVQQELSKLSPKKELTTRTYKTLDDAKLAGLIERYGNDEVNSWMGEEMIRGGE